MNKYKELFKNTSIMAISQFSSKILVFFLVPLYTSVLTTSEYGIYDLVQSTIQLMIPLLTLNIVDAVMRFLMDKEKNPIVVITLGIRYLLSGSSLLIIVIILIRVLGLIPVVEGLEGLIIMLFIATLFQQFLVQVAKGLDFVKEMGIAGVIGTGVTILACILCLLVFEMKLKGFILANILGQMMPAIYLSIRMKIWSYCKFSQSERLNKTTHREMLVYCVPLLTNTLGWLVNTYLNKYSVAVILGEDANGLLGVAYKIPTILVTLQSIFNQAWQISAVKVYENEKETGFYCNIFVMMNVVMCLGCCGLIILIKPLATILFAKDFFVAWKFVPLLLVSSVINAVAGVIGAILGAKKETRTMAIAGLAGIIVNILLNILLVYKIGIQGAAIATVFSSFVIYIVRQKATQDIFDKGLILKVLVSWGLLILQSIVSISVQTIVGYLVQILLIVLMLVLNWKYVEKLIGAIFKLIQKRG